MFEILKESVIEGVARLRLHRWGFDPDFAVAHLMGRPLPPTKNNRVPKISWADFALQIETDLDARHGGGLLGRQGEILRPLREIAFTVWGQPYSKANRRQLVPGAQGRMRSIKSREALRWTNAVEADLTEIFGPRRPDRSYFEKEKLRVDLILHYETNRPDLDESLLLDLLEGFAYRNDRQVRERHVYHCLSRTPRADVIISSVAGNG